MLNSGIRIRAGLFIALMLMAVILSGCKSKMDLALEQAKKQAAATGQAQQVVSVDKKELRR
jgi:PBP1b-binding outer membrane lipoprotein LpoB